MPRINVGAVTSEADGKEWGSWSLSVSAGLDEAPGPILEDAIARLHAAIDAVPPEMRYPRNAVADKTSGISEAGIETSTPATIIVSSDGRGGILFENREGQIRVCPANRQPKAPSV